MKKLKNILLIIVAAFKYFCRWMWKDHWIWTTLIISTIFSAIFICPVWAVAIFVILAIPGAFVSWNLWYDKNH